MTPFSTAKTPVCVERLPPLTKFGIKSVPWRWAHLYLDGSSEGIKVMVDSTLVRRRCLSVSVIHEQVFLRRPRMSIQDQTVFEKQSGNSVL